MSDEDFVKVVVYGPYDRVVARVRLMVVVARKLGGRAWIIRRCDSWEGYEVDVRIEGLSPAAAAAFRRAFGVVRIDARPYDMRKR